VSVGYQQSPNERVPGQRQWDFAPRQTFAVGGSAYSVTTADVNGDGKPDVLGALVTSNAVSVQHERREPEPRASTDHV